MIKRLDGEKKTKKKSKDREWDSGIQDLRNVPSNLTFIDVKKKKEILTIGICYICELCKCKRNDKVHGCSTRKIRFATLGLFLGYE